MVSNCSRARTLQRRVLALDEQLEVGDVREIAQLGSRLVELIGGLLNEHEVEVVGGPAAAGSAAFGLWGDTDDGQRRVHFVDEGSCPVDGGGAGSTRLIQHHHPHAVS